MKEALLLVRIPDRTEALERLLGAVRRKALAVHRLSVRAPEDGVVDVVLRFDPVRSPRDRMTAELGSLFDVREIQTLDGARPTREMALLHIRGDEPVGEGDGRVVEWAPSGVVIEVTGTPAEVDDIMARFRDRGVLADAVRTGEVVVPRTLDGGGNSARDRSNPGGDAPGTEAGEAVA